MQKPQNKLAVAACHHNGCKFLYPSTDKSLEIRQMDGQYEFFSFVEKSIKYNVAEMIKSAPKIVNKVESILAGSLAMILCYIVRVGHWYKFENSPKWTLNELYRSKNSIQLEVTWTQEFWSLLEVRTRHTNTWPTWMYSLLPKRNESCWIFVH